MKYYIICIFLIFTLSGCANTQQSSEQSSEQPSSSVSESSSSTAISDIIEEPEQAELYDVTFSLNNRGYLDLTKESILFSYQKGVLERHNLSVQPSELGKSMNKLLYIEEYGDFPPYGTDQLFSIAVEKDNLLAYCNISIGDLWVYNVDYSGTKTKAKDVGNVMQVLPRSLKNGAILLYDKMIDWDGNEWPVQLQFDKKGYLTLWDKIGDKYYIEDVYYDPDEKRYIALFGSIPPVMLEWWSRGEMPELHELDEILTATGDDYYETGIVIFDENGQEVNRFYFEQQEGKEIGGLGISYFSKGYWCHGSYRLIPISKDEFLMADISSAYGCYVINLKTKELRDLDGVEEIKSFAAANPQITLYDWRFYKTPKPCPLVVEYQKDGTYVYTGDEERKQLAKLEPKEGSRYEPRFYTVDDTDTTYILFQEVEAS